MGQTRMWLLSGENLVTPHLGFLFLGRAYRLEKNRLNIKIPLNDVVHVLHFINASIIMTEEFVLVLALKS